MPPMDQLAYRIKQRLPRVFQRIETAARGVTVLRYGSSIRRTLDEALVKGTVRGEAAVVRPLGNGDLETLRAFLAQQPEEHLRYFRPHGFDSAALRRVLASRAFLNYGLFVGDRLAAYALLKVSPTGSAFIGFLVGPDYTGLGLGHFLVGYLYWQASKAGLRTRSTISRHNPASLRSHESVATFEVVADLPNDYLLIEFPPGRPEIPFLKIG